MPDEVQSKYAVYSKSWICERYGGISLDTLRGWIEPHLQHLIDHLDYKPNQKILTPKQWEYIKSKLE